MICPPTQKTTVFETVDEYVEGTLRSSYERSGVCFGGFCPKKHVEDHGFDPVWAPHQSLDHKNHFMFYENWVSKKDLDEHLSMPHMKSHLEKVKEFLAGPPELALWEKIG